MLKKKKKKQGIPSFQNFFFVVYSTEHKDSTWPSLLCVEFRDHGTGLAMVIFLLLTLQQFLQRALSLTQESCIFQRHPSNSARLSCQLMKLSCCQLFSALSNLFNQGKVLTDGIREHMVLPKFSRIKRNHEVQDMTGFGFLFLCTIHLFIHLADTF